MCYIPKPYNVDLKDERNREGKIYIGHGHTQRDDLYRRFGLYSLSLKFEPGRNSDIERIPILESEPAKLKINDQRCGVLSKSSGCQLMMGQISLVEIELALYPKS